LLASWLSCVASKGVQSFHGPATEDPRVTKCLTAKRESRAVEFKEQFDPTDNRQALEVLKDIVAICNAGGGTLAIGIDNAGKGCGSDVQPVLDYDHAKIL